MADTTIKIMDRLQDNFTMVPNEFCRDPRVTPEAARLYIYLASKSPKRPVSMSDVRACTGMGIAATLEALAVLEKLEYVEEGEG